jgi:Xaa-Pro aminopeptidase
MTRLQRLTQSLHTACIDSLLVSSPSNIFYLTGFRGLAPWEREAFLLILGERCILVTDQRYEAQAREVRDITVSVTESGQNYYQKIVQLLTDSRLPTASHPTSPSTSLKASKLAFEYRDLKYLEFEYISRLVANTVLEPQDGIVEEMRMVKDSNELDIISEACRITDQVYDAIFKEELVGKTEAEVSFLIETLSRKFGGEGNSFIPIVATGLNSSLSHHRPETTKISDGPLFIDFGVKYKGYTSDITRTHFVRKGEVTSPADFKEFDDTYKKILEAQQTAIDKIKPGMLGKEAYQIAYDVLDKYNLAQYFHHSLGHGVGIDIHENPRLSRTSEIVLKENMVCTVEPGVYIPGKFGIQIEDTVVITTSGCNALTGSRKKLIDQRG